MDEVNLLSLRDQVMKNSSPYKIVRRDAIEYVGRLEDGSDVSAPYDGYGKNVYRVEGKELLFNDFTSKQLDEIIGLTAKQARVVRRASGEAGVRDFRNYLATAGSMTNPVSVALIANPTSRTVSGLVPIKEEAITADVFFDFVEIFLEKNHLVPVRYQMAYDISAGLTLYMDSDTPLVRSIAPSEDFLINSYYLKWHLGQVELGRYYERLICSNGQTQTITSKEARITSVRGERVSALLSIPRNVGYLDGDFNRFGGKALEAMEVRASMRELKQVSEKLEAYLVDTRVAQQLAPYAREIRLYETAGFNTDQAFLGELKASMSVWGLYNGVTDYASNNTQWAESDNRRGMLQAEALKFLMHNRDVRNYSDIF